MQFIYFVFICSCKKNTKNSGAAKWPPRCMFIGRCYALLFLNHVVDEDAGGLDVFGSDAAGGDNLLRLDDDGVGGVRLLTVVVGMLAMACLAPTRRLRIL